jgi:hypothetical protein
VISFLISLADVLPFIPLFLSIPCSSRLFSISKGDFSCLRKEQSFDFFSSLNAQLPEIASVKIDRMTQNAILYVERPRLYLTIISSIFSSSVCRTTTTKRTWSMPDAARGCWRWGGGNSAPSLPLRCVHQSLASLFLLAIISNNRCRSFAGPGDDARGR